MPEIEHYEAAKGSVETHIKALTRSQEQNYLR